MDCPIHSRYSRFRTKVSCVISEFFGELKRKMTQVRIERSVGKSGHIERRKSIFNLTLLPIRYIPRGLEIRNVHPVGVKAIDVPDHRLIRLIFCSVKPVAIDQIEMESREFSVVVKVSTKHPTTI